MAYPLNTTFYRLPDVYATSASVTGLVEAMYQSLTSSVDYRGVTIPSTHLWTWATASTSGTISVVYNTAVPSGSDITQNPTILIVGFTGSATPTMTAGDSYAASNLLMGTNKNGTTYVNWSNSLPMTTGSFTGYSLLSPVGANATTTFIRNYISQNLLFTTIVQGPATQYWGFAGALIEPHISFASSSATTASCETDDRLYGIMTNGAVATGNNILTAASVPFYGRMRCFLPATGSTALVGKRVLQTAALANQIVDINGNYVFDRIRIIRGPGGAYQANGSMGNMTGIFYGAVSTLNKNEIRSGSVDLFHIAAADLAASTQYIVLKAAP